MADVGVNRGPISGMDLYSHLRGPGQNISLGPESNAEMFGQKTYNDLYNLGVAGERFFNTTMQTAIERDHQRQADEAAMQALAYNRAAHEKLAELSTTEGRNAFDVEKKFEEWDAEYRPRFGESVNSGLAGSLFKKHTEQTFTQGMAQMSVHQVKQAKAYDSQVMDAVMGSFMEATRLNPAAYSQIRENVVNAV